MAEEKELTNHPESAESPADRSEWTSAAPPAAGTLAGVVRNMALPPISPMLAKDSGETIRRLAEIGKAWADTPTLPSMPTLPDQRLFSASPAIERLRATPSVGQQIGAMATIAEAQLEELGALQATINDLQTVTAKGHRQMVWPTRVIAGLTSVLVILTMVLVFLTWVLLSRSAATSPLTTPATTPGVASPSP